MSFTTVSKRGSSSSFSSYSGMSLNSSRKISGVTCFSTRGVSAGGVYLERALSVYGGAGGRGTRISQSSLASNDETALITNEKLTMQNLNDRLASYLEKVRSLATANSKLELQIKEFNEKRAPAVSRNHSSFFDIITDLHVKITERRKENQSVVLQIEDAVMATEDFKMKYECELNLRTMVENDILRLRGVRDSLTLQISDLEVQIESLTEELVYIKKNHEEEMKLPRVQQTGAVTVDMNTGQSSDLTKVLLEVREQYEALIAKNKVELTKWFESKVSALQTEITTSTTEVKTSHSQLSEINKNYQSLEISRLSAQAEVQCLQQNVEEVKSRYSVQLSQLQMTINTLEAELQQLRVSIEQQQSEYTLLLDIKMRLEMEITEYRRLLEGQKVEKKAVVISKVVEEQVEEHKPVIEKRVKIIVEKIVDGKVVSTSVDTQVENIQ